MRGPEGTWRADVLASDPGGAWRTALEAQLSPITENDITARTELMRAGGVSSVWFSDRLRPPWFGAVPWARVEAPDEGGLAVVEGLVKFSGGSWEAGPEVPAAEFLRWVFGARVVAHRRQAPVRSPLVTRRILWTTPQYAYQEAVHLDAEERHRREQREYSRRALEEQQARRALAEAHQRQRDQERAADGDREAAVRALIARQNALQLPVARFVHRSTGAHPFVDDHGSREVAMGLPVYIGTTLYGVICPVASRIAPVRDRLSDLIVFVASEGERRRIAAQTRPGQRIAVLDTGHPSMPSPRRPAEQEPLPLQGDLGR